ncbi:potassium/proton antiporter [Alteromonas sp. RKMC-009]|uniref:potassium/proton antiporter n=1 Tax=Alteromonas sp. RKMC-009 TaxID=2267264 RepID=UPI000E686098|nr:potassium/proton antiporter [Alteromonas sp. RKMC-009]AYA65348.1 potassium/proton antiporter [Alteromonas sp. RKMC-009]MEC7690121.1 potassium/proton antiporter [Pseudomonadota bacterium]
MFAIDYQILIAAVLLFVGILSSKLSPRLGLPLLVLFLLVGMLAGEDGLGLAFDDASTAHALGTLALAMILFDGGLQTSFSSIKLVWKPASFLATFGVAITAGITGYAAAFILGVPPMVGLLIGAIVGSTDAAAVFSILRNAGVHISPRLKATLEIESASNDPMAIFLTVGILELLTSQMKPGWDLAQLFIQQMGIGTVVGLGVGWAAVKLINRITLSAAGLYPVLVAICGFLTFGISASLGGSGFLATFIAGVFIGNSRFVLKRATFMFHDGLAWLSQIGMFVMLGLLVNPASLLKVWLEGLLIAAVLIFVARPLAVAPFLAFAGFNKREIGLVSWVGLRGSVPIILAIFPLLFEIPQAYLIFNVVFFVVLISATLQGSTLPWMAKKLKLIEKAPVTPAATLEISALGEVNADIVQYTLGDSAKAVNRTLAELALPEGAVVAMITRGDAVFPPRGSTLLLPGDHIFILIRPGLRPFIDCIFSHISQLEPSAFKSGELVLKGAARVHEISHAYGLDLGETKNITLDAFIRKHLSDDVAEGLTLHHAAGRFEVKAVRNGLAVAVQFTADSRLSES